MLCSTIYILCLYALLPLTEIISSVSSPVYLEKVHSSSIAGQSASKMAPNYPHLVFLPLCGSPPTLNSPDLCDNDIVDNDGV